MQKFLFCFVKLLILKMAFKLKFVPSSTSTSTFFFHWGKSNLHVSQNCFQYSKNKGFFLYFCLIFFSLVEFVENKICFCLLCAEIVVKCLALFCCFSSKKCLHQFHCYLIGFYVLFLKLNWSFFSTLINLRLFFVSWFKL